jgi:hypothetical protein
MIALATRGNIQEHSIRGASDGRKDCAVACRIGVLDLRVGDYLGSGRRQEVEGQGGHG